MPSVNGYSRQPSGRYKSQIIPVNNIIGLEKYYRSAHLLLRQVLIVDSDDASPIQSCNFLISVHLGSP